MKLTIARKVLGASFALALTAGASSAYAAAPAAGTVIGNQATASYSDGGGNNFTATSGLVNSTVEQVASLTLTSTQTKSAAQGQFVYFAHTLTNKGNGTDTFNLTTVENAGTATLAAPVVYRDNNANGVVDVGDTVITSIQLAGGASAALIVQTQVTSGTNAQVDSVDLTATSVFDGSKLATNTDTVTVTTGAVINVLKGITVNSGGPGTETTYTLTYQNNGNAPAMNVVLADIVPTGFTYVAGSGRVSTTQVLTDDSAAETNTAGVVYQFASGRVSATIANVPVGGSGTIQFKVTVNPGVAAGVLNNTGYYCITSASCTVANVGAANGIPTNTVPFTVVQSTSVVLNGSLTNPADGTDEPLVIASANQGATVVFEDYVHNTGNGTDNFNITVVAGNSFPVGTAFQLFKSDGATPLLDTNSDGIVDSGDLPVGGAYKVVLKAILPAGASGAGPYAVTLRATSVLGDATTADNSNDMINRLTTILANTVDLTNGPGLGELAGTDTVITTKAVNPGSAATFILQVKGGTSADTYAFSAWGDFAATAQVNSNFTVAFFTDTSAANDCSTIGSQVSDTGNISPGATSYFCGVVTSASVTPAGTTAKVYFRVRSNSTGTSDIKLDEVTVNAAHAISLNPDNAQQAFPGGNVIYIHTLANNGNSPETISLAKTDTNGLSSVIYVDAAGAGEGTFGPEDLVYSGPISLLQNGSVKIFVTVAVPSNTVVGTSSVTTITATAVSGPVDSATDTTSVVGGFISLTKTGMNDVLCDGNLTGTAAQVKPSECIEYTIVASNIGSYLATDVVINDVVPAFTAYSAVPAPASCLGSVGVVACTAASASGAVSTTPVSLQPGQTVTLKFTVRVEGLAP